MLLLAAGLAGCMEAPGTNRVDGAYARPVQAAAAAQEVGEVTYRAVDRLVDIGANRLDPGATISVGAFTDRQAVSADGQTPGASAAFGSFVADLVRTRLVQRGLIVSDLQAPRLVRVNLRAARRRRRVALAHAVGSEIVTGTYTDGPELTYISLRMVSAHSSRILAAVDFAVPRTR